MTSSTLLYIAWPLTLGLSFVAGGVILSHKPTTQNSQNGSQTAKASHKNTFSNRSINKNSTAINRRSSATPSRSGKDTYAGPDDLKKFLAINDSHELLKTFLAMINRLGPGDFEQTLTDFDELGLSQYSDEYELLLNAWAKINPEGALAYSKEHIIESYLGGSHAIDIILTTWARYAPNAATQWARLNHKRRSHTNPHLVGIIQGIANTNLERATDLLHELPWSYAFDHRRIALRTIVQHVSKLSTEKATAWLATIKDEKLHASATQSLVPSLARKDLQATADWIKTLSPNKQHESAGYVARAWAKKDIDKAAEWTSSLEGKTRINAASSMIYQYASSDPNKAATWMKTMSGDPDYQNLVSSFIRSTRSNHPKTALSNLDQLGSDDARGYYSHDIIQEWAAKDKEAATKWMQSNNIDATAQKIILTTPPKWRR